MSRRDLREPLRGVAAAVARRLRALPRESRHATFRRIYRENLWGDAESRSGPGSSVAETSALVVELPSLFKNLGIRSILDVPCGDFAWMCRVDLDGIRYVGADIVPEVIAANRRWESRDRRFVRRDLVRDRLPRCDLAIVRDCLVHLSNRDALLSLANLVRSGCRYLLVTSFCDQRENLDIPTGRWRPLNLELPPFGLPPPVLRLAEQSRETEYADKSLALWRASDVASALSRVPVGPWWSFWYRLRQALPARSRAAGSRDSASGRVGSA